MSSDLLDLVDQLTKPHDVEIRDRGRLLGIRTEQALLVQLRKNITASIGPGNGSKAAHERSNHNSAASELYGSIERRVRQWAIRVGYVPNGHNAETVLRGWYSTVYLNHHFDVAAHFVTLAGWIDAITDLLDPPHRYPLNAPCPICGQHWATTDQGGHDERSHALNVIERDPAHLSSVTCRNCGAVWHGVEGAEALADLLHTGPVAVPHEASA